jgi:hypothetical protein
MAIDTVFKTGTYELVFDTQYGVSWYVRKKDDHVSLMNTGTEAEDEVKWAKGLKQNKEDKTLFNSIAAEHSFSPRWSEANGES